MSFINSVQAAIFTALDGDATLGALIAAVYDDVPQVADAGADSDFPYVTVGEDILTDWSTDTESGGDITVTVHSWSRDWGRKQTKQIQDAVYNVLHRAELTISGHTFVMIDFLQANSFVDTDGKTRHGVMTFRLLLDQQ